MPGAVQSALLGGSVKGGEAIVYATLDPTRKGTYVVLSEENLKAASVSTAWNTVAATIPLSTGKWYWEARMVGNVGYCMAGAEYFFATQRYGPGHAYTGGQTDCKGWSWHAANYDVFHENFPNNPIMPNYLINDYLCFALDLDDANGVLKGRLNNGAWQTIDSNVKGHELPIRPTCSVYNTGAVKVNFGASAFVYAVPDGYNAGVYSLE